MLLYIYICYCINYYMYYIYSDMCVFAIHLNNSEASNSRLRFKSPWFGASPLLLRVQIEDPHMKTLHQDGYHWILMVFF